MSTTDTSNSGGFVKLSEEENSRLARQLIESKQGDLSKYASVGNDFIRRRLRERGFLRSVLPSRPCTNDMLDRTERSGNLPVRIEDMEPNSAGAVTLPFQSTNDQMWFGEDRFVIKFNYVQSREYYKDVNELRTPRMDIRQVTLNNALLDLEYAEDATAVNAWDRIVGPLGGTGTYSTVTQNHEIQGNFTRANYRKIVNFLTANMLNTGLVLMNTETASQFLEWDRLEVGGDLAEKLFTDGTNAIKEQRIFGIRHLFTLKRDLIPTNVLYLFAPPNFLGRFYELEKPTVYAKREEDILRFKIKELIGVTWANVLGIHRVEFTGE